MMRTVLVVAVVLGGAGLGCGGSSDSLNCAWLGGDNCWKMTLDDAVACLPPQTDQGTFSADHKTCTYASGVTVTFATPLVFPIPDRPIWNFTVSNGGTACLHYEDTGSTMKVVVNGQTVTQQGGGLGISITCPDGTTVSNSNELKLFDCNADAGVSLGGVPGTFYSSSGQSLSVGLLGGSQSTPLFDCQQMP